MPKNKSQDEIEEVAEIAEPEVVESPEPEVEEEPKDEPEVNETSIDLDAIPLVFDKDTVALWLSKAYARLVNQMDGALLISSALPEKQAQTVLVWAIAAVKPGGVVVVPEVLMGSEYLEPLEYEGAVKDFFAFRK